MLTIKFHLFQNLLLSLLISYITLNLCHEFCFNIPRRVMTDGNVMPMMPFSVSLNCVTCICLYSVQFHWIFNSEVSFAGFYFLFGCNSRCWSSTLYNTGMHYLQDHLSQDGLSARSDRMDIVLVPSPKYCHLMGTRNFPWQPQAWQDAKGETK